MNKRRFKNIMYFNKIQISMNGTDLFNIYDTYGYLFEGI